MFILDVSEISHLMPVVPFILFLLYNNPHWYKIDFSNLHLRKM